jgi:hypothetical protein
MARADLYPTQMNSITLISSKINGMTPIAFKMNRVIPITYITAAVVLNASVALAQVYAVVYR